jgi:energy-converting hydrogenase Eha subunit C
VTELLVPFAVSELNVKAVIATFAATVLLSGVKVNPDLITATVIFDPLGTVMLLMLKRYKPVLLRDKAPFVAPLTLKSDAVKPSMSALNVKARVVVVTALLDPLALRELNVIDVVTTFAATDLLDGVKVTPDLATATVIFDPFGTVILLIPKVYAPVPVLFSNPLVAPVTVISDADKPGTSELKVMNSVVVLTELLDPLPVSEEKVIEVVATFAATVLLDGVKVNPVLATATVILDPFDTVILPMPKV